MTQTSMSDASSSSRRHGSRNSRFFNVTTPLSITSDRNGLVQKWVAVSRSRPADGTYGLLREQFHAGDPIPHRRLRGNPHPPLQGSGVDGTEVGGHFRFALVEVAQARHGADHAAGYRGPGDFASLSALEWAQVACRPNASSWCPITS